MAKQFGGFNQSQMETLARKMGFDGPMHKFQEFLNASPNKAAELGELTKKALDLFEGAQKLASGGAVKEDLSKYKGKKTKLLTSSKKTSDNSIPFQEKGKTVYITPEYKAYLDGKGGTKTDTKSTPLPTTKTPTKSDPTPLPKTITAANTTQNILKDPSSAVTEAKTTKIDDEGNQFIKKGVGQIKDASSAAAGKPVATSIAQAGKAKEANTYTATKVEGKVDDVLDNTKAVQGTVSSKAQVEAATALPSANATVQGQLDGLMKQFEGGEPPAWAAGAMRMAQTAMAARGLGSSSMAGGAITQAAMESAIGIAVQDAQTFSAFEMTNLNNRQQARLQNAQAFLQMDLANLDIANQTNLFKAQSRIQTLFTDQAADNAAKQFNATSKNQTDQFFSQLKAQVSQFNASQKNAMKTANADRRASVSMFNAQQRAARDEFNATNSLIIAQANAKWRQTIATTDAAEQNETNRLNAQMLTQMTTQAYNNLWQSERDLMQYAFTAAQNSDQRAHEVVLQKLSAKANKNGDPVKQAIGSAAGSLVSTIITKGVGGIVDKVVGGIF